MIGTELDFLNRIQQPFSDHSKLKARFASGVKWERASFLKAPPEVIDEINTEAADNLVRLKRFLKLPNLPTIALLTDWDEILPEEQRVIHEVYADATVEEDLFPYGRIRISPSILKAFVTERTGIPHRPPVSLEGLLGHEAFHIWQFLNMREQVERDISVYGKQGLIAWMQTQTEIDAREHERYWIEYGQRH